MSILISIPKALWKIGLAWFIISVLLDILGISYPPILTWLGFLNFFIVLDMSLYFAFGQMFGSFFAKMRYGKNMPSVDNYDCKVDYILPFEGKWTALNGGTSKELSHSWGLVSQRYAYDFVIMDDAGKSFAGDNKNLESYFCYGKNILAPANGTVVKVSSKHKDSRVTGTKVYCDTWDIRGNFIVIQHAKKEFSVCAHLISNSITVRVGDKVKQGQIIGKCGNSGNTSEPHLHFQLQSGKSFFTSAGLPISFVDINAGEKANYSMRDSRNPQKEVQTARGNGRVYIGRGLEVEHANSHDG